jgi:hypothetical protein
MTQKMDHMTALFSEIRFIVKVYEEVDKHRPNGHHHEDNNVSVGKPR